jgi:DNA-binding transcriptional ArsR family regulator
VPNEEPSGWAAMDELRVEQPDAIDVLWYPRKRLYLKPFLGKAVDLAGAARELGIRKNAMSYWIDRLLEVGLIREVHVEKRPRHKVRFYRCVADKLRVGLMNAPLASYEDVFENFHSRWKQHALTALAESLERQSSELELCITSSDTSGVFSTIMPKQGSSLRDDFIYYWARLWLTEAERVALQAEMDALYDKYAALSNRNAKREQVLVHLIQVPEGRRTARNRNSAGTSTGTGTATGSAA